MYNKGVFLLLFIFTFILSCSDKKKNSETIPGDENEIIDIDIENQLHQQVSSLHLSDVAASIDIVPLELMSKSMIRDIDEIGVTDNEIVTADYRQILHFSNEGKFLNGIGKLGGAPDEYPDTHSFLIHEKQREVYVLTGQGIKVYGFEGEFKRDASKQKTEEMFQAGIEGRILSFSDYLFLNDKLPLDHYSLNEDFWSIALTDTLFNIQKKFFNPTFIGRYQEMNKPENRLSHYEFKNNLVENPTNIDYYGGKFKIKYDGVDTIYQFNEHELTFDPVYSFRLGNRPSFETSHAWIKDDDFFNYLWLYDFFDSKEYIYFLAGQKDIVYTIRYHKTEKEIKVLKEKSEIRERRLPGSTLIHRRLEREFKLTNDLCGGVDFVVDFKTASGYWISVQQPDDLLEKINIDDLKQAEVKDKAARDKLIEILMNLSEDDNPVLFIVKLK